MRVLKTVDLNRALMERQLLRRRVKMSAAAVIEHLVGMQAQVPASPYVGLWSRIAGFKPEELSNLLLARAAVRTTLMRDTIHLVSARDCVVLRPVLQSMLAARYWGCSFGRNLAGVDRAAVISAGRAFVDEKPRTNIELGRLLQKKWPACDAVALGYAIRNLVCLVQVPPRGVWRQGGLPTLAAAETWIGRPMAAISDADETLVRYLRAFGPATVADMQQWSGLSGLKETVERLRPRLKMFRDERGRELFDVPDGARPRTRAAMPARFLPEYDNVLLAHEDRSRVVPPEHRDYVVRPIGRSAVLVDGFARAFWKVEQTDRRAVLQVVLLDRIAARHRAAIEEEGLKLLVFLAPEKIVKTVRFTTRTR